MPLALDDPRWSELSGSYGDTSTIVSWLRKAAGDPSGITEEQIGFLINEVQHQGEVSSAVYSVAPHLILLSAEAPAETALRLLIFAGMMYADSSGPGAERCPAFLLDEFSSFAASGAVLLAPFLSSPLPWAEFALAIAALAGFQGHHDFGRFMESLTIAGGLLDHPYFPSPISTDS